MDKSKDLTEEWRRLSEAAAVTPPETPPARGKAEAVRSAAVPASAAKQSGGGVASPLTETSFASRVYWPTVTVQSTDGFITYQIQPIRKVFFTDASASPVELNYAQPT